MNEWKACIQRADLTGAITTLIDHIKQQATDVQARSQLVELLCIDGQFERAEAQLLILLKQNPDFIPGGTELRHLMHAAQARADFMQGAATVKFLGDNDDEANSALVMLTVALHKKEGDLDALNAEHEAQRQPAPIVHQDKAYEDTRDLDDQLNGYLECFGNGGDYFLVPFSQIQSLALRPAANLIETVWRKAELELISGQAGELFIPVTYFHSSTGAQKLGRETDWLAHDGSELVQGLGHKMLLMGEQPLVLGQSEGWTAQINAEQPDTVA